MTIKMLDIERQRARLEPGLSQAIEAVLAHGGFINGPEVRALEKAISGYAGVAHTVSCANGTDALQILMRAIGAGPGDAVFLPSLTFVATAEAVSLTGATPVFIDVAQDGNMDPASLEAAVADLRRAGDLVPRAAIVVDLFSVPADHAALSAICTHEGLKLIYDAAQSFGSETAHGRCGSFGDAAATSFYPSKSLGGYGDGGAIMTQSDEIAASARTIANHGSSDGAHVSLGTNSRLDSLQAAVLLKKLAVFDDELAARRRIAARYGAALSNYCAVPVVADGDAPCWAYYVIRAERRDALMAHLGEAGVPSAAYYKRPIHAQPIFSASRCAPGGLPGTEAWSDTLLCLPSHPYMTDAEVDRVIDAVQGFFGAG